MKRTLRNLVAVIALPVLAAGNGTALAAESSPVPSPVLHVTAVRDYQPGTDPEPVSRAFRIHVITGTVGETTYTLQQMLSWGVTRLEPGSDYEVVKTEPRSMTVVVHDKKGRADKERVDVTGISK